MNSNTKHASDQETEYVITKSMNLVTIGMFSLNIQGIGGSILLMLSHGLVSSALFLCVGVLYDRHKTRLVRYYGGLVSAMPNFSTVFFFFTLANMSLPGTSSFIGEFLILVGAFQRNSLVATLAALGMILLHIFVVIHILIIRHLHKHFFLIIHSSL
ncbi:putative NADH:ubiquinone reductase (H(+)-translocating) [Helianthus debilis subsp. tardiflorus]